MDKRLHKKRKKQQRKPKQNLPENAVNSNQQVDTSFCRSDIISNLPNDILHNIISLLPGETAAGTRLLSTQWNNLWNTTLVKQGSLKDAGEELSSFLSKADWLNPLRRPWNLQFHIHDGSILSAATGAKSKLQLSSSSRFLDQHQSRRFFLDLELNSQEHSICPPCLSTSLIKSLYLTSIDPQFSEVVSLLVSSLPFLESIEIKECESLFCLRIHGGTKLQQLAIIDCPQLESLSVLAHGLKSFKYKGRYPDTSVMGMCDCKHMALDFREGPGYKDFKRLSSHSLLLLYLKDAEYITLCQWTFEVMIKPRIWSKEKIVIFSKLKELCWIDSSVEEDKIESLISFLEICPSLERVFIRIDPTCYSIPRKRNVSSIALPSDKQLHHLKMIKMVGFNSQEDEILVGNRILEMVNNDPVIVTTRSFFDNPSNLEETHITYK